MKGLNRWGSAVPPAKPRFPIPIGLGSKTLTFPVLIIADFYTPFRATPYYYCSTVAHLIGAMCKSMEIRGSSGPTTRS